MSYEAPSYNYLLHVKEPWVIDVIPHDILNDPQKKGINKFIEAGNKVKVVIMLRGREVQHAHLAMALMEKILADLEGFTLSIEKKPAREGNNVLMILAP